VCPCMTVSREPSGRLAQSCGRKMSGARRVLRGSEALGLRCRPDDGYGGGAAKRAGPDDRSGLEAWPANRPV